MTNEQYLSLSYSICAVLSLVLGGLVYFFLRRPFAALTDTTGRTHLRSVLKKLFPVGLLFPALLGFVSVSYLSCDRPNYDEVVQSRAYLIGKNQQQISAILLSIVVAILVWNVILVFVVKHSQNRG
jgi:hypothetical protein